MNRDNLSSDEMRTLLTAAFNSNPLAVSHYLENVDKHGGRDRFALFVSDDPSYAAASKHALPQSPGALFYVGIVTRRTMGGVFAVNPALRAALDSPLRDDTIRVVVSLFPERTVYLDVIQVGAIPMPKAGDA